MNCVDISTNNNHPLISVIVPVYKVEKYLRRCIESILNQTYTNLEIILVDDGSPDNCGAICNEYAEKDSRITVIHQENKGLSAARNSGLDICTGEYVTFIDSDDYVGNDYFSHLYNNISDVDYVACGFTRIKKHEEIQYKYCAEKEIIQTGIETLVSHYNGQNAAKNISAVYSWGRLYKKTLWENLRFTEGIFFEDIHLMPYILLKCAKVKFIPYAGYYYREVRTSTTNNTNSQHRRKLFSDSYVIWEQHEILYKQCEMSALIKEVQLLKVDKIISHAINNTLPDDLKKWSLLEFRKTAKELIKKDIPFFKKAKYLLFALVGPKRYGFIYRKIRSVLHEN